MSSDRIDLAAIRARVAEVGMAECARCHTPTHINDIVGGDLCIGCDTDDANASVLEGLRLCVQCEDTEAEFASSLCIDCSEGFASDLDTCDECGHNPRQCDAFETDNALLKQMVDKLRAELDDARNVALGAVEDCAGLRASLEEISEASIDLIAAGDKLRAENVSLREIIAGRTTAPTDAEIEAHHKAGGRWRCLVPSNLRMSNDGLSEHAARMQVRMLDALGLDACWWALDASGAPCAWPVVTKEVDRG